jgi:hypothetical protein
VAGLGVLLLADLAADVSAALLPAAGQDSHGRDSLTVAAALITGQEEAEQEAAAAEQAADAELIEQTLAGGF